MSITCAVQYVPEKEVDKMILGTNLKRSLKECRRSQSIRNAHR